MMSNSINNSSPLISVVMSVYNDIQYLDKSVKSILAQTEKDFEFIIFDDGSTDGSREKLIEYSQQDDRIVLVLNEENIGLTKNLNAGLKKAKGKFIARMDGDDYSFPTRFEKQLELFHLAETTVLTGTSFYTIDKNDHRYKINIEAQSDWETHWIAIFRPPIMHPSSMFRRSLVTNENLYYDEAAFPAEDFNMWSQMLKLGNCTVTQEPLIEYRLHSANISATKKDAQLAKTKQITRENIAYHFPAISDKHAKKFDDLVQFLYIEIEPFDVKTITSAITAMDILTHEYINNISASTSQKKQIRMLASRWLVKALLKKTKSSFIARFLGLCNLYKFSDGIFFESIEFVKRRLAKN